jgi:enamine deaminase RidA (YjgF/YER057c/UK114 family)
MGASHESCCDVFALRVAINDCTSRRIHGQDTFQLSRAFSPGVITSGGAIVWVAGQTATQDSQGNNIANNFEAQVKQVFAQIDGVLKRAGGSLDNVVTMTVFIKESRYGDNSLKCGRITSRMETIPEAR